ncbi:tyrosine--tRNA ligase [Candidatus Pacearchaeota archaeon]|nr:tyrosine--tRNA ligase [Candidatus Pacearchaeota archaeon]
MDLNERLELIKRNTAEIIGEDKIKSFLGKGVVYCGYEVSGEIHLGHLVTILKLLDLQKAGIKVKILLADWHTWLNQKGNWKFVNEQTKQWERGFKSVGLKAEIVKGTSYQMKQDYFEDILKLALKITVNRGVRAMQQVARDIENAKISQIIYPLMQVADVKHLKTNFVVAGLDQRKIYMLGVDEGKEIGLQDAVYLYTPIIPSLRGAEGKMSSSVKDSFISIRDSKESIKEKVNRSYCPLHDISNNPILAIIKLIILPMFGEIYVKGVKKEEDKTFKNYEELENTFENGYVWPSDLKNAVAKYLNEIIEPIRKKWK